MGDRPPIEYANSDLSKNLQSIVPDQLKDPITRRQFLTTLRNYGLAAGWAATLGNFFPFTQVARHIVSPGSLPSPGSPEYEKQITVYHPREAVLINNKPLKLIGVAHSVQTYYNNREDIKQRVKQAPKFVILEYFNDEIAKAGKPFLLDAPIPTEINVDNYNGQVALFFASIAKECARNGKEIIVVNPQNLYSELMDFFGAFGLAGALVYHDKRHLRTLLNKLTNRADMDRRELLKLPVEIAARALGYGISIPNFIDAYTGTNTAKNMRSGLADLGVLTTDLAPADQAQILAWHELDWRDVSSANGIARLFEIFNNDLTAGLETPMFQGDSHNGIIEYVKSNQLRRAKTAAYAPFNLGGDRNIKRYGYDTGQQKWVLLEQIPY